MSKQLSEDRVRALLRAAADELGPVAPDPRPAVRRARRRLARNAIAVTLSIAALAAGAVTISSRAPEEFPPVGSNDPADAFEIWTMSLDGLNAIRITGAKGNDADPAFSPDGRSVAFSSERSGNADIWVMRLDGTGLRRLTRDDADEARPAWSPDGRMIALTRWSNGVSSVVVVDASDGSEIDRIDAAGTPAFLRDRLVYACRLDLANETGDVCVADVPRAGALPPLIATPALEHSPAVSPDGSKIVFVSNREGQEDLFVMDADGSNVNRLTWDGQDDREPVWAGDRILFVRAEDVWSTDPRQPVTSERGVTLDPRQHDGRPAVSPDGKRLAIQRRVDPASNIFVMSADGKGTAQLTNVDAINGGAVASPDGRLIAFASTRDGYAAIYVMEADGSNQRALTSDTDGSFRPVWSPDGRMIAYRRDRDIWLMNADGSNQRRLTQEGGDEMYPSWSPDGRLVAFSDEGSVWVIGADGSNPRLVVERGLYQSFSADGRLAFVRPGDGKDELWIASGSGANARKVVSTDGIIAAPWWGTGGEVLYTVRGNMYAADPATGRIRSLGAGFGPSWTPDGRILFNKS